MRRRLLLPLIFIVVVAFAGLAIVKATIGGPELGLDLQGGVSVVLQPTTRTDSGQLDVALEVIRNRVDALGVAEPEIVRQGGSIVVQLPGVENRDRALELVGQTAELRFRPVLNEIPTDQVSLNFAKIKVEYRAQKADGSLDKAITAGWDVKTNKQL